MSRVGGSQQVRSAIAQAFAGGHGVTAKIRWISPRVAARGNSSGDGDEDDGARAGSGKGRWIHCTPLLGSNGSVGVWMVVLVDDEREEELATRRVKGAPPVNLRRADNSPRGAQPGGNNNNNNNNRVFDGHHYDGGGDDDIGDKGQMSLSSFAAVQDNLDEHRQVLGLELGPEARRPRHPPSDLRSVRSAPRPGGRSFQHGLRALFSKRNRYDIEKEKGSGVVMVEPHGMTDDARSDSHK